MRAARRIFEARCPCGVVLLERTESEARGQPATTQALLIKALLAHHAATGCTNRTGHARYAVKGTPWDPPPGELPPQVVHVVDGPPPEGSP